MLESLLYLSIYLTLISAANLPAGIKKCKLDSTLNECVLKQAEQAIPILAKGDPKFGIPVLDPLIIPKIEQTQGRENSISMNLTMENINATGLSKARLDKSEIDVSKKIFKLVYIINEFRMESDYVLNGKFLLFPVTGKGKASITQVMTSYLTAKYKLVNKKGVEHMVFTRPIQIIYKPSKVIYNLENLFNGDKLLGDNMNKLMNENWEEVNNQLGGGIAEGFAEVWYIVLNKFVNAVPYNDLYLH